ncbi:MAG: hypothetical protein AAGU21_22605 [Solidesulfovibrio sp.]|uniref:hypothetical protein n=1 Tax=Solidesulfovibrio sp. TaxID=2910990 RepID=UPI002B1F4475|nr:hypothetical protein [Solidesulfovibrio sp.]MEA4858238.1 hypothetical protein [Solidesulfovibrio sp.]
MRGWIVGIALVACVMTGGTAMARQADGFAGTAFGTPLAALPSFMTLKKDGAVTYAVNLNERYRLDGHAPVVIYGFAAGKLFAAYVRLDGQIGRDAMVKRLSAEFGKPSFVMEGGVEVLRWRRGELKVKLKFNAATGSLKLGYYSVANAGPAAALPEPDSVDIDSLVKLYEKDKVAKGVSLPAAPAPKGYSPYDDGVADPAGRYPGK